MCVCMCVCVCVCACVHMHICTYVCEYVCILPESESINSLCVLTGPQQELSILVSIKELFSIQSGNSGMEPRHREHGNGTSSHDS